MTYAQRAAQLGIDRGALASGEWELSHRPGSEAYMPGMTRKDAKPKPPPIDEDLSRFAPKTPRLTEFKALLAARGESIAGLAQKMGLSPETIRRMVFANPAKYSAKSWAMLKTLLRPNEWAMVEGP